MWAYVQNSVLFVCVCVLFMFHFFHTLNNCSCCHIKCFYLCSSTLTWNKFCVFFIFSFLSPFLVCSRFSLICACIMNIPYTHKHIQNANNSCKKLFIHCALQSLSIFSVTLVVVLLCIFFSLFLSKQYSYSIVEYVISILHVFLSLYPKIK